MNILIVRNQNKQHKDYLNFIKTLTEIFDEACKTISTEQIKYSEYSLSELFDIFRQMEEDSIVDSYKVPF